MKLLKEGNYVSIHRRNLQILATEMYEVSKESSPPLKLDIFKLRSKQTLI